MNLEGEGGTAYLIANDLMRSLHLELKNAQVHGAKYILVPNASNKIIIEYVVDGVFYSGILEVDLEKFLFKEVLFNNINKPSINVMKQKIKDDPLDLSIELHSKYF